MRNRGIIHHTKNHSDIKQSLLKTDSYYRKYIERTCTKCSRKKWIRIDGFREKCFQCAKRRNKPKCEICHNEYGPRKGGSFNKRFCSRKCLGISFSGEGHPQFKNARTKSLGYIIISRNGKVYPEHRWIMKQHLNRNLTENEVVHHINGIKDDNRIENLVIMTNSEHMRHHAKFIKRKIQKKRSQPDIIKKIWIDVKNNYRKWIVRKCKRCKKLWWSRNDHSAKFCSSKCLDFAKNLWKYRWGYL